ncbi:hypothetical protein AFAE65S_01364 [Alcaligenes phenolicus]
MMWDERYSDENYVYGTAPNTFLAEHVQMLQGPVLSVAEGEGRNAVFMASRGLDVLGVDGSAVGLAKARQLAQRHGVTIRVEQADLASYVPPEATFGAVVSIFGHLPGQALKRLHALVERALRPGGIFLLESYSKAQIDRDTGGPKNLNMLVAREDIEQEFQACEILLSQEIEREVIEGQFHTGMAGVVQFIARKKAA